MDTIAFAGLGAMGAPMTARLLKQGFNVRAYDVRAAATAQFAQIGGIACASPAEAAEGAPYFILMVVNAAQAEQVLFKDGALNALPRGGTVILMATCPPKAAQDLSGRVLAEGRHFIDAPVSGGVVGAKAGTLTIMAGCPREDLDKARPIFEAMGDKIFHVGEKPGQGAMAKTINQLLCGVHIAAAAEALSLAEKAGVSLDVMLEIVSGSAASSWMLRDRGKRMLETAPEVTSAVDIFVKDLGIVLEAGTSSKMALPLAAIAHQMFLAVSGQGHGALDDSQVIRAYRGLAGLSGSGS